MQDITHGGGSTRHSRAAAEDHRLGVGANGDGKADGKSKGAAKRSRTPASAASAGGADNPTVAEQLVRIAQAHYRFGRTDLDEPFAVAASGPNVALMLRGGGDALRVRLAKLFRASSGRTPGASALADALMVLTGDCLDADAEPVALRMADHGGEIVIDLGDRSGRAVVVRAGGWQVADRSPVLFRRTALTGALPLPERGGRIDDLRGLLNVSDSDWPLVVCFLLSAFLPSIPHPILLVGGLQGTGKSVGTRVLVSLFDPSGAPLRAEPRDLDQWQIAASGSWGVALDNLSCIPPWLADALCRASTGDGLVKRRLYSDSDLAVLSFRRVILLNSIDAGALRGDLAERLLLVELEPIPDAERRTDAELVAEIRRLHPRLFGALLDALALVLKELPAVRPARLPRMADFARVLAAADAAGVTVGAFDRFNGQQGRLAEQVVDSDPFAAALRDFMRDRAAWTGSATELLGELLPDSDRPPHGWPRRNGVKGHLKRIAPALASEGIRIIADDRDASRERRRVLRIENRKYGVESAQSARDDGNPGFSDAAAGASPALPGASGRFAGASDGDGNPAFSESRAIPGASGGFPRLPSISAEPLLDDLDTVNRMLAEAEAGGELGDGDGDIPF